MATVLDSHGRAYLTLGVAIAILVLVPHCKLFWEILLNLLVGKLLAHTLRNKGKQLTFCKFTNYSQNKKCGKRNNQLLM